ncbi:hypothetical protein N8I77_009531 [Diaporthe amygdali]|uniref:Uncharacterized protein n=1 Tax=Phomopsis amygdali TaxID=1214568 RepID=A0AAD9SAC8_PHOAM|nr:hypothetical protein N8I77_009531 [Diaporthe amygdali]
MVLRRRRLANRPGAVLPGLNLVPCCSKSGVSITIGSDRASQDEPVIIYGRKEIDRQRGSGLGLGSGSTIALPAKGTGSDDVRQLLRYTWVRLNEKGASVKPGTASPAIRGEEKAVPSFGRYGQSPPHLPFFTLAISPGWLWGVPCYGRGERAWASWEWGGLKLLARLKTDLQHHHHRIVKPPQPAIPHFLREGDFPRLSGCLSPSTLVAPANQTPICLRLRHK